MNKKIEITIKGKKYFLEIGEIGSHGVPGYFDLNVKGKKEGYRYGLRTQEDVDHEEAERWPPR
jgi:hypothetical protein